jgi:hypothetical protein
LITLLETSTRTSITTGGLSLKPFPLGIHLLALLSTTIARFTSV